MKEFIKILSPLQGFYSITQFLGRCPWLFYFAPLGLKKTGSSSIG